jgi:hypothetical protein
MIFNNFCNSIFAQRIKKDLIESGDIGRVYPIPIHISGDGFGMFKHSANGPVSVYPQFISPIFAAPKDKNKNVQLHCLSPGPQQSRLEMFSEELYKEIEELSEPFPCRGGKFRNQTFQSLLCCIVGRLSTHARNYSTQASSRKISLPLLRFCWK